MKQQMIPMPAERPVSAAWHQPALSGLKNNPTVRHDAHEWTLRPPNTVVLPNRPPFVKGDCSHSSALSCIQGPASWASPGPEREDSGARGVRPRGHPAEQAICSKKQSSKNKKMEEGSRVNGAVEDLISNRCTQSDPIIKRTSFIAPERT
ncbi:unnamed protein product [Lota lota]